MKTGSARSTILLYVLFLALVVSPTLPCQAASVPLGGRKLMAPPPPILMCTQCACCAPAPPGSCCRCGCSGGP
ncbi:hypothetical protein ISN45_Aa03g023520 [Arabidopsis thaliana x Arabidopsis arenosa]|uniref:Transmembrane protein n=2 Tax=Arabidopsis TaxID=3701 RepID=A0A8T2B7U5_ARASU|nr:hypothetical protein ISN45_Aa03g023520 [Arabidopsis thaliana x Arabidopsis arenosa]KAG7582815.1 hypothetical protein ISN44_As08g023740 [Arabidopsis suecica]